MDLQSAIASLKAQLQKIIQQQQDNQQQQIGVKQEIEDLDRQLQDYLKLQAELDCEAIRLFEQKEHVDQKIAKLQQISRIANEFSQLQQELKTDQQLLDLLYNSMMFADVAPSPAITGESLNDGADLNAEENQQWLFQSEPEPMNLIITIDQIKRNLPNAEIIHQQLGDRYTETYQSYRNLLVEQLDLIWCTLAFIAFDRALYLQLSHKYHPDKGGSAQKMQLLNAAWEIYQDWRKST